MSSCWKIIVAGLVALAVGACGASSKADTAPSGEGTESHDTHAGHEMAGHHDMGKHHEMPSNEGGGADVKAPGEAQVGDDTTCPVSGRTFTVTAETASVEHQGKTYYFCCGGCDDRFKADPEKYLAK